MGYVRTPAIGFLFDPTARIPFDNGGLETLFSLYATPTQESTYNTAYDAFTAAAATQATTPSDANAAAQASALATLRGAGVSIITSIPASPQPNEQRILTGSISSENTWDSLDWSGSVLILK